MKWVALMPLRGGSKSIPDKNIREIAGRPLFAWSLEAALEARCFDAVYVASDSPRIRDCVAEQFPVGVEVIDRSAASATDTASTEQVMLEFQQRVPFDVLCLIQATSPLTAAEDFRAAQTRFRTHMLDSLLTGVRSDRFVWSPKGTPLNYEPSRRPRRQEFDGSYIENGAFYFTRSEVLSEQRSRLGGRIGIHAMHEDTVHEIDDPLDWTTVERLLLERSRRTPTAEALRRIRVVVVDVDGTLTDGGMYYGPDGEALKKFNTRDAKGLELLRDIGIHVCVMTGEDSPSVAARMRKLGFTDYCPGAKDKPPLLDTRLSEWLCEADEVAFIGDDVGDLECITRVGFGCAPADAVPAVKRVADYVCSRAGGAGAVREVCDLLLAAHEAAGSSR